MRESRTIRPKEARERREGGKTHIEMQDSFRFSYTLWRITRLLLIRHSPIIKATHSGPLPRWLKTSHEASRCATLCWTRIVRALASSFRPQIRSPPMQGNLLPSVSDVMCWWLPGRDVGFCEMYTPIAHCRLLRVVAQRRQRRYHFLFSVFSPLSNDFSFSFQKHSFKAFTPIIHQPPTPQSSSPPPAPPSTARPTRPSRPPASTSSPRPAS